jgi:hypothetical protein
MLFLAIISLGQGAADTLLKFVVYHFSVLDSGDHRDVGNNVHLTRKQQL